MMFRVGRVDLPQVVHERREESLALGRDSGHRAGRRECGQGVGRLAKLLINGRRLGRADTGQEQQDAPPRCLVPRVLHNPQVSQHILDVGLLKEPQAAAHRVGNAARDQLALEHHAVVVVAVEDRHLAERNLLVPGFEDLLADQVGLLVNVGRGGNHGAKAVSSGRDQLLGKPRAVVPDRRRREGDDLGRGPVVDVELKASRPGMPLGELENIVVVRAPEAVNRLGVVPHGRQIPRPARGDGLDDLDLKRIGVLHLVNQDMPEHARLVLELLGKLTQEPQPLGQEVVIIHAIGRQLAPGVGGGDDLDPGQPLDQPRRLDGGDIGERLPGIESEADQVLDLGGFRRSLSLPAKPASSMASLMRSSWSSLSSIVKLGS